MQRPNPIGGVTQTVRRPLKIFATDPLLGRTFGNRARIDIANENLQPGPVGPRVEVIDYDGARDCFYEAVDLNNPAVLMQGGLDPSESDPRFHQQMVYAVAMKTIENFDRRRNACENTIVERVVAVDLVSFQRVQGIGRQQRRHAIGVGRNRRIHADHIADR